MKSQAFKEEAYDCTVDEVWKRAGNYTDLNWAGIPKVVSAVEDGVFVRRITAPDGGLFVTGLLEQGEHFYTYKLISAPPRLEVTDYVATLSASQNAEGKATLKFSATFECAADKEAAMIELLKGLYDMQLSALSQSLSGSS